MEVCLKCSFFTVHIFSLHCTTAKKHWEPGKCCWLAAGVRSEVMSWSWWWQLYTLRRYSALHHRHTGQTSAARPHTDNNQCRALMSPLHTAQGGIFIVHNSGILEFPLLCLQFETEAGVGLGWKCCVQEPDRCGQVAVERQSSGQQSNCYKLRLAAATRLTLLVCAGQNREDWWESWTNTLFCYEW